MPIDEGIKDTVAAFQLLDFNTQASCEGHLDRDLLTPWIDIGAPNQPTIRYNGEQEIYEKISAAHGVTVEDMRHWSTDAATEAEQEAVILASEHGETPEYLAWRKQSLRQANRMQDFLNEFYGPHPDVRDDIRLSCTQTVYDGSWRILTGNSPYDAAATAIRTPAEKDLLLRARQGEMRKFTEFLREKYPEVVLKTPTSNGVSCFWHPPILLSPQRVLSDSPVQTLPSVSLLKQRNTEGIYFFPIRSLRHVGAHSSHVMERLPSCRVMR